MIIKRERIYNWSIKIDQFNCFSSEKLLYFFQLTKSHEFGFFKIGTTPVKYVALDNHNNSNICIINITVEGM